MMRVQWMMVGLALMAGGCGKWPEKDGAAQGNSPPVASPTMPTATPPAPLPTDAWIGKWRGVEGLALDVAKGDTPGSYRLHMALLDAAADYTGTADGDVIHFTRDGQRETIRHTDGAATGLKWLADKKDCLTVQPGVGFCRD